MNDFMVMDVAKRNRLLVLDCMDATKIAFDALTIDSGALRVPDAYILSKIWYGTVVGEGKVPFGCALKEKNTDNYIFAFRGTANMAEFQVDIDFDDALFRPFAASHEDFDPKLVVSQGFYSIYVTMRDEVFEFLKSIKKISRLAITGHSLGSSLAGFFSLDCMLSKEMIGLNYSSQFNCFAGTPRSISPFTHALYLDKIKEQKIESLDLLNINDIVTQVSERFVQFPYVLAMNFNAGGDIHIRHALIEYRGNFESITQ